MKVAILGTGNVGQTLAEKFISQGHHVTMGTRNVQETLQRSSTPNFGNWLNENSSIQLTTFNEAAKASEIIVIALHGGNVLPVLKACDKESFENKVIIDLSNPLDFSNGFPPSLIEGFNNSHSLGEAVQHALPGAKVVKTLNTMWCGLMLSPTLIHSGQHINFVCGNDAAAKQNVTNLLLTFGWTKENILDLGDITNARGTEAYLLLWTRIYGATNNGAFNLQIVK